VTRLSASTTTSALRRCGAKAEAAVPTMISAWLNTWACFYIGYLIS
jgi:hypothetical protein